MWIEIVGYPGETLVTRLWFIYSSVGTGFQDGALVGAGPHNIHNTVLCNLVPSYCASICRELHSLDQLHWVG
jgi:hypothetical protein